jgi:hypothetical protein
MGKPRRGLYTKGELNKAIDSVIHPLIARSRWFLALDGFLHALVEHDPASSARKFLSYDAPYIASLVSGGSKPLEKATRDLVRESRRLAGQWRRIQKRPRQ